MAKSVSKTKSSIPGLSKPSKEVKEREPREPSPDDSLLETDDEEDEFAEGFTDIERGSESEEDDGEGVGMYEADDWNGEDDQSASDEDAEEDDEKAQMVRISK
jgi:hypothetical protein